MGWQHHFPCFYAFSALLEGFGGCVKCLFSSSLISGTCHIGHLDSRILDFLNECLCVFRRTLQVTYMVLFTVIGIYDRTDFMHQHI